MRPPRISTVSRNEMRVTLAIVWLGVAGAFVSLGWLAWDLPGNRGYAFGYYGEFNRVSHALASIPEVAIVRAWHNSDLSLEEFGFHLNVSGQPLELDFSETDLIRSMSHEAAVAALKSRIASQLPAAR